MIKALGLVSIGISTAMIGIKCSQIIKRRIDILTMLVYILGEFTDKACFLQEPLPEIIKHTIPKVTGIYKKWLCDLEKRLSGDEMAGFSKAWDESLIIFKNNGLNENEMNILREFGIRIINLNEDRLSEILHKYINTIEVYINELREEYKVKSKLYRSMGVLLGLFIIIIVI